MMANGENFGQGLLANPLFNIGAGLLAASGPSTQPNNLGQGLLQGLQSAQRGQRSQAQNQLARARLEQAARARQQQEQLRARLPGVIQSLGQSPEQTQGLLALADVAPEEVAGLLAKQAVRPPQNPTNLQREFEFLVRQGMSPERALEALKKGTTVNVGTGAEKPLSVPDLGKLRRPDGSPLPFGTTPSQAVQAGATVLSADQQKGLDAADKFGGVLDQMEDLALGEGGVFTGIQPGFANRAKAGFDLFLGSVNRDNPNIEAYNSLAQGTIAPFVRQLGESGALSDGDVRRALALLPQIRGEFLLPDTQEDARNKLDTLREILERGVAKAKGQTRGQKAETRTPRVTPGAISRMSAGEIGNVDSSKLDAAGIRALEKRLTELGF